MNDPVLELREVVQTFKQGHIIIEVLKGINLTINKGEIVALVGPSGSGKSTLLQIAGLLEKPVSGTIKVDGRSTANLEDNKLTEMRLDYLGFVYQYHHLLPEFSARENIIVPQMIANIDKETARNRADELLKVMNLTKRSHHRPAKLSGGEQQRVAIARALVNSPKILLADEPTGNLDPITADEVFIMLTKLAQNFGVGALIATHNPTLAKRMDKVVNLKDGLLSVG